MNKIVRKTTNKIKRLTNPVTEKVGYLVGYPIGFVRGFGMAAHEFRSAYKIVKETRNHE